MLAIARQMIVPLVLAAVGAAALVYGMFFHYIPVMEEKESQTTIEIPAPFAPSSAAVEGAPSGDPAGSPFGDPLGNPMGDPSGDPLGAPGGEPLMLKKTVTQIERKTLSVSEPALTRDVTVGGAALLASGELKRTYDSSSEKGPALCPS